MTEQKSQLDKFKEAARELACEDDEQAFNEKVGKLLKVKPPGPQGPGGK